MVDGPASHVPRVHCIVALPVASHPLLPSISDAGASLPTAFRRLGLDCACASLASADTLCFVASGRTFFGLRAGPYNGDRDQVCPLTAPLILESAQTKRR